VLQLENELSYSKFRWREEVKTMPKEHLDKDRILELLAKADSKWFSDHSGQFKYRAHLTFVAGYVAENYHKRGKGVENRKL
jgi:hypothetical protein